MIGAAGANQVTEDYTFDAQTGLLNRQTAIKAGASTSFIDLSYNYARNNSVGNLNGKTGHLTKIINNLNTQKNREYEFDAVGRLTMAKGGPTGTLWTQTYTYDRWGNRLTVAKTGTAAGGGTMPLDGIAGLTYDNASNRLNKTIGAHQFQYDVNGNQTKTLAEDGSTWVRYEYDSANRLWLVKRDSDGVMLQRFGYGATNARFQSLDAVANKWTIYAATGGNVLAEYIENSPNTPSWAKSYTYFGGSQLATITPNGGYTAEITEFNHPDRLGTRLVTSQAGGTSYEQVHLPFGRSLDAESGGSTAQRFTSYERSSITKLDYAINRTYDSKLGRFTQVDPIGMGAVSLAAPQTLNMYTYCGNDPVNYTDPSGLFFGKLFRWIGKHLKKIFTAIAIALAVVAVVLFPWSAPVTFKAILGLVASLASAASSVFDLAGLKTLSKVFGIIAMAAGIAALGFEIKGALQKLKNLRSMIFSFADDPIIYAEVTIKISFWDKVAATISSYSNQISTAIGLSNLTAAGSGVGGGSAQGGLANDLSSRLGCLGNVWWRSVPKTIESVASIEAGKALIASGILLGRFFVGHARSATSINPINISSNVSHVGMPSGGLIGMGGAGVYHGVKTGVNNAANSINGVKRCSRPIP